MRINADFSKRVAVTPEEYSWVTSPAAGVERVMLDRIGEEVARATSLVRFAPGARFDAHTHDGGEEFLVLEGVFSDETGDFPAGTYMRNPIGTRHAPRTAAGCTIFVKLHQFAPADTAQFHVDTGAGGFVPDSRAGVDVLPLHRVPGETVSLERLAPGARPSPETYSGGAEFLVLEGRLETGGAGYPSGSWLRLPPGASLCASAPAGCTVWKKTGHLANMLPASA